MISLPARMLARVVASVIVLGCMVLAAPVRPAAAQGGPPGGAPAGGGGGELELHVSPDRVEMPAPGVQEFDVGIVEDGGAGTTVQVDAPGRRPWRLLIQSADPDLGGYGKPLEDLLWQVDGTGPWTPLSTGETRVACGRGAGTVTVRFRMRLDYTLDRPDRYGTRLEFRARSGGGC